MVSEEIYAELCPVCGAEYAGDALSKANLALASASTEIEGLKKRVKVLEEAIRTIYTTQMYEERKKEKGVSIEMIDAILEAAKIAGLREDV